LSLIRFRLCSYLSQLKVWESVVRICFICVEIFAWGKYGGFGRATRIIGRELVKRGIEVFAVVPRRKGQKPVEELDGITVLSFPPYHPLSAIDFSKQCDADIYHSQEPSLVTYLAMRAMPNRKHVVTFRDPRDTQDWKIEFLNPSISKLRVLCNYLYEDSFLVKRAIQRANGVFCTAQHLVSKVKSKYGLKSDPNFLPTPVFVADKVQKSITPTVCFLARWDKRKRPEIFFNLAKKFPHVKFIAIGKAQDMEWDGYLRKTYSSLPNLEMTGFIDQFATDELSRLLEKSWILVNSATREGLPTSFLEALSHRCAILSQVNPDGIAERFGYHVKDDDFVQGLERLLERDAWREKGESGYRYVKENYELRKVIDQHISVYCETLKK